MPLGSLYGTGWSDLSPDKLATMITNIESQRDTENTWPRLSHPNSSEERLTIAHAAPRKMEVGIHHTFEVTQTTAHGENRIGSHRMVREHLY